jgi:argininosuccinate synthase
MEQELKERLSKLVKGLLIDEVVRQSLLEAVEKNQIDQKLLEKVKFFIDQAIVDYQVEADKQIEKIRTNLNETLSNLDKDFVDIEKDTKEEVKVSARLKDQKNLEEIRKKLAQ